MTTRIEEHSNAYTNPSRPADVVNSFFMQHAQHLRADLADLYLAVYKEIEPDGTLKTMNMSDILSIMDRLHESNLAKELVQLSSGTESARDYFSQNNNSMNDLLDLFKVVDEEIMSDGSLKTGDMTAILKAMEKLSFVSKVELKKSMGEVDARDVVRSAIKDSSQSIYTVQATHQINNENEPKDFTLLIASNKGFEGARNKAMRELQGKAVCHSVKLKINHEDIGEIITGISRADGVTNEDAYSIATGHSCDYLGDGEWRVNGKTLSQNELLEDILIGLIKKDDFIKTLVKVTFAESDSRMGF